MKGGEKWHEARPNIKECFHPLFLLWQTEKEGKKKGEKKRNMTGPPSISDEKH